MDSHLLGILLQSLFIENVGREMNEVHQGHWICENDPGALRVVKQIFIVLAGDLIGGFVRKKENHVLGGTVVPTPVFFPLEVANVSSYGAGVVLTST